MFTHTFRARFKSGIVIEFLPPVQLSNRVVIICDGLPSVPSKKKLLQSLSNRGFWSVHLRYRGTWESNGRFLRESPDKDIALLLNDLQRKFKDIWSGKQFHIKSPKFFVIGSSFGGTSAIFSSLDSRISKGIALAPVSDWKRQRQIEPLGYLKKVIEQGFGPAYRFSSKDWNRLCSGTFFNLSTTALKFEPDKLIVIHATDDDIVTVSQSRSFCQKHNLRLIELTSGGHLSSSDILQPKLWRQVCRFLR